MKDLEICHLSIIAIAFKQLLILTIVILFIAMTKLKIGSLLKGISLNLTRDRNVKIFQKFRNSAGVMIAQWLWGFSKEPTIMSLR